MADRSGYMAGADMEQLDVHSSQVKVFQRQDRIFHKVTLLFAFLVLAGLFGILLSLAIEALPALREFGPSFVWTNVWNVPEERFGGVIAIYGTVVTSLIALLVAVPVSFGIALFLTETCPAWLRRPLGTAIELLAGVPSIIYGIWGLFIFAPLFARYVQPYLQGMFGSIPVIGGWFSGPPIGIGILAAGIVLALMVIPFVASVMRDVFETVPSVLKESAYGVGCTTWEVVWNVVLPYTRVVSSAGYVGAGAGAWRNHGGNLRDRQCQ